MKKELKDLRELMEKEGIDVLITADADDHISEYTGPHFAAMQFLSGFTGGDGTLVIAKEEAGLWTDGRYFIQAAIELAGSGIALMKMGEPDCPDMNEWIEEHLPEGGALSFDGRTVSAKSMKKLLKPLKGKKIRVVSDRDLPGEIWGEKRPAEPEEKLWILSEQYAGKSVKEKICDLKKELLSEGAGATVVSALDEVAWFLNLRGNDIPCNPVFSSFLLFDMGDGPCTAESCHNHETLIRLYVTKGHLTGEVKKYLSENHIEICTEVERIYEDVSGIRADAIVLDLGKTSFRLVGSLPEKAEIIDRVSPLEAAKNIKNPVEAANLRIAQVKDSTAVTRFMYWFKKELALHEGDPETGLTECSTAEKLHGFRAGEEGFLGDSFEAISAYGENAAMCHYSPDPSRDVKVLPKGLYLVDSGGHYPEGSTDITRTWACGPVTEEEKHYYTLVAMANLRLADSVFLDKTSGMTLDYPTREIFWKARENFNHGTGHGVGYLLNVHEGPASIRYRAVSGRPEADFFTEGVYCSDEPGFYVEGKFGVRLENMLLTVKDTENEYGKFMKFEALTLVPFDRECMDVSLMTEEDVRLYNAYHQRVFETIAPLLSKEEAAWLQGMCEPLSKS